MDTLSDIKQIRRDRFSDSRQWMSEVFPRLYRDDEILTIIDNDHVVSELLLRRMELLYQDVPLPMGFISGAATHRKEQSKGYMTRLLHDAILTAHSRGDALVTLLPTRRRLYYFFGRLGFKAVCFIDEQRYTSVHKFVYPEAEFIIESTVCDVEEFANAYRRLASQRPCHAMHDEADFRTILIDNSLSGGIVSLARRAENGQIAAIAFANTSPSGINVKELVYENEDAMNAALSGVSAHWPDLMTIIDAYPERKGVKLYGRGMARIVNVEKFLAAIATIDPKLNYSIRVTDPIIASNNGVFTIAKGKVTHAAETLTEYTNCTDRKPDLDVSIDVLTQIVFSAPSIGSIFGLPTARPSLALMI